jgi:hypothetical protein
MQPHEKKCLGEEGLITCSSLQESHLREPVESNVGGVVLAEQPLAKGRMIQRIMGTTSGERAHDSEDYEDRHCPFF